MNTALKNAIKHFLFIYRLLKKKPADQIYLSLFFSAYASIMYFRDSRYTPYKSKN